uniref:Uncharacterized protein n=1 Tax=Anguilla anguilla TaxID=7936 RepID=A0A0E9R657_ANGAN
MRACWVCVYILL